MSAAPEPRAGLTYPEVGATRDDSLPRGYHPLTRRVAVGAPEDFAAAADFVLGFGLQRGAGLQVTASTRVAAVGTEVVMGVRYGPVRLLAPARVVLVLDEPDRRGFAYGTLPGHPECGEELFVVERDGSATWLVIRAFSRPGRWYTRLAGPVGRLLQRRTTERYVGALRRGLRGG
jgi:uncharacterized protein (UPF0548 family)